MITLDRVRGSIILKDSAAMEPFLEGPRGARVEPVFAQTGAIFERFLVDFEVLGGGVVYRGEQY